MTSTKKVPLVDQEKLRFDFSHKAQVTLPELKKIEDSSNSYIKQNCKIYAKDVDLDVAKGIEGVRAVFGETYPNPVRVVSVGVDVDTLLENPQEPRLDESQRRILRWNSRRPDRSDQGSRHR
jgi:alanyl-tRNA synthetase